MATSVPAIVKRIRLRILHPIGGLNFNFAIGDQVEVPELAAGRLIIRGFAEAIDPVAGKDAADLARKDSTPVGVNGGYQPVSTVVNPYGA